MGRQIRQLDELMDGALTERFNREMARVLENVFDPNTNPKAKRQIQITVDIVPDERRQAAKFSVDVKSKVAAPVPIAQMVFLDRDDEGNVTAEEITRQVPGQIDMDGKEQPLPKVIEFDGKAQTK